MQFMGELGIDARLVTKTNKFKELELVLEVKQVGLELFKPVSSKTEPFVDEVRPKAARLDNPRLRKYLSWARMCHY